MRAGQVQPLKRRRLGKTDYRQRYKLLVSGKPRLVFRKKSKNLIMQVSKYNPKGDQVITACTTSDLGKYGWNIARRNTPSAYLLGFLIGLKSKNKGIQDAVYDLGLHKATKGSIIFAALKGAVDAGLNIQHSKELFPSEDRIKGIHIKKSPFESVLTKIKNEFKVK